MSNSYGQPDLPTKILADEFEILKEEIENNFDDELDFKYKSQTNENLCLDVKNILEYCYKLDENEVPFQYKLLNINKLINRFDQKVDNEDKKVSETHL